MSERLVIGNATLYHADCREVLPTLPAHDLMLTDPPYGIGINKSHRLATSRGHGGESWDDKPVPQWLMLLMAEQAKHLIVWGGQLLHDGAGAVLPDLGQAERRARLCRL